MARLSIQRTLSIFAGFSVLVLSVSAANLLSFLGFLQKAFLKHFCTSLVSKKRTAAVASHGPS